MWSADFRGKIISKNKNQTTRHISIASALAMSFGTLVSVAILTVLGVSLVTGLANTRDLLLEKATAEMDTVRSNLTNLLDPAEDQVRFVSDLIYNGNINIEDKKSLENGLMAALSGSLSITGLVFVFPDYSVTIADRRTRKIYTFQKQNDPVIMNSLEAMKISRVASWSKLLYAPDAGETVMSFHQPIFKNDIFIGAVIAAIPISALNKAIKKDAQTSDENRFILYGKDHVLTQQGVSINSTNVTYDDVVPKLSEIEDQALATIWTAPREPIRLFGGHLSFKGHFTKIDGERYQFFYESLEGYTDRPLIIGYRLKFDDAVREVRRLAYAGWTGLLILLVSILIAFIVGRKISKPIIALSKASQKISGLEFESVDPLPSSRLKELNEASDAYNTMLRGLGWFETYVPKSLVRKLMRSGDAHSETRNITVMFTDIVSFTPMAENMPSEQVAEMLNSHFELMTTCIEAEGGTVDKFIGDSVMAFWGAPEHQEDHAARACRAAQAIRQAIAQDNLVREAAGKKAIRIRIGIHTGPLVVGNIGSTGRINYTVVGDTVNIAQRIEQLGKTLSEHNNEDALTLFSDAVHMGAPEINQYQNLGKHFVKGRLAGLEIYKLTN